jgi:hypothetical protein
MTVYINTFESSYDERRIAAREFTIAVSLIFLAGCFGVGAIIASTMYESNIFTNILSEKVVPTAIDLGSVTGFVTSSDGLANIWSINTGLQAYGFSKFSR